MKPRLGNLSGIVSLLILALLFLCLPSQSAFARKKKKKPTPTPTPTLTPTPTPVPTPAPADAARFLTQSTFGPTTSLITLVQQVGFSSFLDGQFSTAQTETLPIVDATTATLPSGTDPSYPEFQDAWWLAVVKGQDQLRQRVALALSEIMVISANGSGMYPHPEAMATYWDLLGRDAFGNFRQLIQDVTLNPAMGDYLDMVHNDKPNPRRNTAYMFAEGVKVPVAWLFQH